LLVSGIVIGLTAFIIAPFFYSDNSDTSKKLIPTQSAKSRYPFGIDISEHQGIIDWLQVKDSYHDVEFVIMRSSMGIDGKDKFFERHNVEFVIMRSSMGIDGKDKFFERNWSYTKQLGFIRGAYHYYRPNEDAETQFYNFVRTVAFEKGDLFPVLDVEKPSREGNEHLVTGVNKWLKLAEKHFGVKPILYSYKDFYNEQLNGKVQGFPVWIAAYTEGTNLAMIEHVFHQYSDSERVSGIRTRVDANRFTDSTKTIENYCFN